ncbi:MAG: sulfate reduction electron transfer complex DsrMKJOP subunit DsrJ [Deltaproteobacteria bacterium]|nr:sulfate reduction electron transfer complex DsrMKJOP subunit DsrJ [Deltaproteobacteria bacterium]
MYDGGKIITGLVVFIGLVTFPLWINVGKAAKKPDPKIDTPVIQQLPEKERKCIEPKAFMQAEHMKILNDWRDSVVRDGNKLYVSSSGKSFNMSLQKECMNCHSNKKKFCDECHNYADVKPYCWTCHIEPKEKEKEKVAWASIEENS